MAAPLPSAEVAADFQDSLQDLQMNNRWEISNLTIIAKENTEFAQAISRVLENHIRMTQPQRKLPSLYVLDSIVKNVGTPYTVYLGRNLYNTFMDAYTLVDSPTRKAMEGMLKTWKEPVPGSIDTRPVFSPEITRAIENALIKARTIAIQHQQTRPRTPQPPISANLAAAQAAGQWRSTPTPPQRGNIYHNSSVPPASGGQQYSIPDTSVATQPYLEHNPTNVIPGLPQVVSFAQTSTISDDYRNLYQDVEALILMAKSDFAKNPLDIATQEKLKALLDLQGILKSQQLPPEAIRLIKDQVTTLSGGSLQPLQPNFPSNLGPITYPLIDTSQQHLPGPQAAATSNSSFPAVNNYSNLDLQQRYQSPSPQVIAPSNAPSSLPPNLIAELLLGKQSYQQPLTDMELSLPLRPPAGAMTPVPIDNDANTPSTNTFLDSLRAAGLITPVPAQSASVPRPFAGNAPAASSVTPLPMPNKQVYQSAASPNQDDNDVELNTVSIRKPRPQLISRLYESRPNQCGSCGRRFAANDEGRQMKARHLDWHFRVNQKLADASSRGQSRNWFLDEMEWIQFREIDEAAPPQAQNGGIERSDGNSIAKKKEPKDHYISIPTDSALANTNCPICQEKFEAVWHDEAQEWVWLDAIRNGSRIYHATCFAEVNKNNFNSEPSRLTPDPILGKRKAQAEDLSMLHARFKKEVIS